MADIFVSYTLSDRNWAFWIGQQLEKLGHVARLHDWEVSAGGNVMAWMDERHKKAERVLCVVSNRYLEQPYSALERHGAQWAAASSRPNFLLPVFVEPCDPPTLLALLKRCELHGLDEADAHARLAAFLRPAAKPVEPVVFPGAMIAASTGGTPPPSAPVAFPGSHWIPNIPISVPRHFLGRDRDLAEIDKALKSGTGRAAVSALHGLRGVGKSTLAAAYAERRRNDYRAIWWIRAETEPTMRADLFGLGVQLGWIAAGMAEELAVKAVLDRLRSEGDGVLLIYDNAIGPNEVDKYLPLGSGPRIIVTSNAPNWGRIAEPVEIEVWPKDVGADFLIARTSRAAERDQALALSEALGGLPLAHDQAAAYCERVGLGLDEYMRSFAAAPAVLLDDVDDVSREYGLTVSKAFSLAIEQAARRHPAAERLVTYAALLAPEPIPLYLFSEGREKFCQSFASAIEGTGLDRFVAALRAFALIDREPMPDERDPQVKTDCIRLHRLVRQVAAARHGAEVQAELRGELIDAIVAAYPAKVHRDPDTWPRARRLDAIAIGLVGEGFLNSESARSSQVHLLNCLAMYRLKVVADFASARTLLERALDLSGTLGPGRPDRALVLSSLASLLDAQGDFVGACERCKEALDIRRQVLGGDHPDTAESLNDLGYLLLVNKDRESARPLLFKALAIRERIDPHNADTAMSLNNIGILLDDEIGPSEARKCHERALAIREKVLKPEDPHIAVSLHNLADVVDRLGEPDAARRHYERALAIHEKAFSPDHPDTATTLNNLACLLQAQEDLTGARRCHERALKIRRKVFEKMHPDTAMSLFNLGVLLDVPDTRAEARQYYEEALSIYEGLDSTSIDTADTLCNLSEALIEEGESSIALRYLERARDIYAARLGRDHPDTRELAKEATALRRKLGVRKKR